MARDPRYDVLFEPVRIGPVTAKNRFYQVPHCTGMGSSLPQTVAAMRGMKAEGGWGVVNTEYCSIHPSSCDAPYPYCRLWDEDDVRDHALMTEAVHEHGSLAGVELWHGGAHVLNRYSREGLLGAGHRPSHNFDPVQARAMDRADIRELRRWQADAARRAVRAGFDIVYIYAGHGYLPAQFLSRRFNERGDEYGGSLENRARLLKEMILDTREAVGPEVAVAVRLMVDEMRAPLGISWEKEGREVIAMLGELPDLWDVQLGEYPVDARSSRFAKEGAQEPYVAFVKSLTTKPVVGVGRFTSPDSMVSQIRRGILDLIGAARPSIADPFLPKKIEEGRLEDIRECIGCNICIAWNGIGAPLRCTQNPTMGEEWRRGWHPEIIPAKGSAARLLVVGAGPAGLEAARALGQRGYEVHLAEATETLGGRVAAEAVLPGLAEWIRVRDWRVGQIERMANVTIYRASRMTAPEVLEFGAEHVVIATGARWRRDGAGRANDRAVAGSNGLNSFTPEDVYAGHEIPGPVLVYDDDHFYLGGVLAEALKRRGLEVALVTPAARASDWTQASLEQPYIQTRLLEAGVAILAGQRLDAVMPDRVRLSCVYTGRMSERPAGSVLMVTARLPEDGLYYALLAEPGRIEASGIRTVTRVGDCFAPSTIAAAVQSGHRYARDLDEPPAPDLSFRVEHIAHGR